MKTHSIVIRPDGTIEFIYSDALRPIIDAAKELKITRVSNVEPTDDGQWIADLAPIDGPVSGSYKLREEALRWEEKWLKEHYLGIPSVDHSHGTGGNGFDAQ